MRLFCLCLVKNEADIVEQTLLSALTWADRIFVADNGSDDGTWEIVDRLSRATSAIEQVGILDRPFDEALWGEIFEYGKSYANPGDWWCRLDADEIYIDNPRIFLSKVLPPHSRVWSSSFEFYFTDLDLERWKTEPHRFPPHARVDESLRYYINNYGELRFVRHDELLAGHETPFGRKWSKGWSVAKGLDVFPVRIWLRHYQYRSPPQIQKRLHSRQEAMNRGFLPHEMRRDWQAGLFSRAAQEDQAKLQSTSELSWEHRIVPASRLVQDRGDNRWTPREDLLTPLPTRRSTRQGRTRRLLRGLRAAVRHRLSE